jgi:prepilin-type N-terminal cleavage/methylation domain-containing protein
LVQLFGRRMKKKTPKGFTLAELLIALMILGEIATFTIPKILSAQTNGRKNAIFKETISTLSALNNQGVTQGQVGPNSGSSSITYFSSNMNAIKICSSNATTQGCWTAAMGATEATEGGMILHNGAYITGFNTSSTVFDSVVIDWNGPDGANLIGDDQIWVNMNFASNTPDMTGNGPKRPGAVGPESHGSAANTALWLSIFG